MGGGIVLGTLWSNLALGTQGDIGVLRKDLFLNSRLLE